MKKIWLFITLLTCSILLTWCFENNNPEVIDDCVIPEDCTTENPSLEDPSNKYFTAFWTEPFRDIEISWWIAKLSSPMFETEYEEPITITQEWENFYIKWEELEGEFIKKDCIDDWKWDLHNYRVSVSKFREYTYEWCWDDEEWIKMSDEDREEDFSNFMTEFSGNIKSCEKDIRENLNMIIENATDISQGWYSYTNIWDSYQAEWYISYSVNGEYYTKDTTCAFQKSDFSDWWEYWNWEIEYRWQWNILWLARSDEEQECIDSLYQYEPEQMPWDPQTIITVSCAGVDYWNSFVTWYIYTTTYPDLWLRISTPAWRRYYDEGSIFKDKSDNPIFVRNWNRISYIHPIALEEMEYIQTFEKSENESLKDIIESKHTNWKCSLLEYNYYSQNTVFAPYPWTIIYWVYEWEERKDCKIDDGEDKWLVRFFESPDKTKYYKLVFMDWCAPGPCSIFGEVELF